MVPYMYFDLVKLHKAVLNVIVKDDVILSCKPSKKVTLIELKDVNFKKNEQCDIGLGTNALLMNLKQKDAIDNSAIRQFYNDVRVVVSKTLNKMNEKSPINSVVVRESTIFYPKLIIANGIDVLQKSLKKL